MIMMVCADKQKNEADSKYAFACFESASLTKTTICDIIKKDERV